MARPLKVLVLCTGNSARSVMAEAILNAIGDGKFEAVSAGSQPKGEVHPRTLDVLRAKGIDTAGLRSKSWDEFAGPEAPQVDIVITVCNNAAAETCPVWPGHPVQVHMGFPDPAAAVGPMEEQLAYFEEVYDMIESHLGKMAALDLRGLGSAELRSALAELSR